MTRTPLDGEAIFTITDFLTPEECAQFIAQSEALGFGDAPLAGGEVIKSFRDNDRATLDDPALAARLFERARAFLPSVIEGHELVDFNERWRFYRYGPGQTFKPHHDGAYHRFRQLQASELTFLIYLNDDFAGGGTNFFHDLLTHFQFGAGPWLCVKPVRGTALVFRHRLLHEGAVVESGRKYVLRTDVMYGRPRGVNAAGRSG
ncbi:2OG-Fe(II) oxygenase [Gemmata sp. JC717]|uniref:prolyl hydroxylase family protein n=1 Tax=Gemmata algarum TaxID=2975278 RepID=UPI0021BB8ABD|nr:2OG-Fe(II) oxygenase [Gemmata algarum]MDY3552460.1 2OG-Fe(II) oxygenase [Gemmata algarum]